MDDLERKNYLSPLGPQRLKILDCLGADNFRGPLYLLPDKTKNVFDLYSNYVDRICERFGSEDDPFTNSLLAAARLLNGDLEAARIIIDCFPDKPFELDHGAGYCIIAPIVAMKAALPIPTNLIDTNKWTSGSVEQTLLHEWLNNHQKRLHWYGVESAYRLIPR